MTIKPFAIQGADLTLGGVNLQAGRDSVVIPGVTQAVNYTVEEVDEFGNDNNQDLGSDAGAITVIDNSRYLALTGTAPSGSYLFAEYSVDELDDGNIEEINVETEGVFLAADKTRAEAGNMWATLTPTPFVSFNPDNWIQIPFRPKFRAGVVENVGGGGSLGNIFNGDPEDSDPNTLKSSESDTYINFAGGSDDDELALGSNNGAPVTISTSGGSSKFEFSAPEDGAGSIKFPDGTVQTTAYTGQSSGNISKRYVAVNNNGTVYGSTDGENWTPYTSTMDNIGRVAVGPTNIVYTADRSSGGGKSLWYASAYNSAPTEVAPAENVQEEYNEVKYFSSIGKYVAVGYVVEGNSFPILLHSSDGVTWTRSYVSEEFIGQVSLTGSARFVDIAENDLGFFIISDSGTWGGFFLENITDALDATTNVEQAESDWEEVVWVETAAEGLRGWHVFDDDEDWRLNSNEDPRVGSFEFFAVEDLDPVFEAALGYEPEPSEIVVGEYNGVSTIVVGTGDGQIMYWPAEPADPTVVIPKPYTSSISDIIRGTTTEIEWSGTRNRQSDGEKIVITGVTTQQGEPGTTNQSYNGTYYIKRVGDDSPYTYELYTNQALTTPWDTSTYWPVNTNTGTLTWSHGQYIDALHYSNGIFYMGNDDEEFFISTDGGATWTETDALTVDQGEEGGYINDIDSYGTTTANKLINGTQEFTLNANGSITFPDGSIQTTAYTGTASDANVWVQTFESVEGAPADVVAAALSVEYDVEGNLICLFNHEQDVNSPFGGDSSYFSVAKIATTGTILWQKRFAANFRTDGWGLAVDSNEGFIYIAGSDIPDNESFDSNAILTKIDLADGDLVWSKIYQVTGTDGQSPVVDIDSDGNPVMVGYYQDGSNSYIATTTVNSANGSVIWSRKFDGQGYERAYGMGVGPNSEVVTVGYTTQYIDVIDSYPVTPQTGSGVEVLVINRSDLNSAEFTTSWKVAGSGIPEYANVSFINSYSGLTSTVQEGSGATFNVTIAGDGSITNPVTIANGGSNYLVGHKIKIPYTAIGGADLNSDIILTVTEVSSGSINTVAAGFYGGGAGTPNTYNAVAGTNYQTGSGLIFSLSLDSGNTYTEHPANITAGGTNYVTGDVVVISGTQLGGTSPANDLTAVVSADNGVVTTFNSFSGTQQTTTYRILVSESEVDFSADGNWTLNTVDVDENDRMLVVKYNSLGDIQWQKAIQFDDGYDCQGADCDIDSAGNIYVTGQYDKTDEPGVALSILKLNSSGVKQWSRRVTGNCDTFGTSIVVGADDNLYLSGITGIENPNENGAPYADTHSVLAKYSTDGTVLWQRLLENSSSWSFTGALFEIGGSNLAVKDDYVAVSGGYGDFDNFIISASVAQVSADGTTFSVGEWDFVASNFSGTFFDNASDLTVVNAGKIDTDFSGDITVVDGATMDPSGSTFLIGTVYRESGADEKLVNGTNELILESTGTVTLPKGGTISEGIVTSNPTIQLTPASPDVSSQKLVIKGGTIGFSRSENGITVSLSDISAVVSDIITVDIISGTRANQLLYWWLYPDGVGVGDSDFGTVILDGNGGGSFTIQVDSDDYEFTVRVSPENNNYDPDNVGVESLTINGEAPAYASPYHLHLTTGDLSETSIFLGTDDHNVRTTVDGGIQVTTQPTDVEPATIIITGADVSAINTTYGRAPMDPPTWTSPSGDMVTDPYIQFVNGQWGIFAPAIDPVLPIYINTGTLYEPLAQWSISPPYGSAAPTGVYIYGTPPVQEWKFSPDGALTLPNNGIIRVAEGSSKIKTVLGVTHDDNWNDGDWVSAEYTAESSQGKIVFVNPIPGLREYLIRRLAQSVATTITINENISLTYDYVDAGMDQVTLYVTEVPATDPTTVTELVISTVAENRMAILDDNNRMEFISGSGWNVDIESKWTGDINLRAGDDILIKAGDKVRSDSTGGDIDITAGSGGNADYDDSGGNGGSVDIFGGTGGSAGTEYNAGGGGAVNIRSGTGGNANITGSNLAGSGADLTLEAGDGGYNQEDVTLGRSGGNVYIYAGDSTNDTAGGDILIQAGVGGATTGGGAITLKTKTTDNADRAWVFDNEGGLTIPGDIVNGAGESFLKDIPQNSPTGYSEGVYALQASDRGRHILIDGIQGNSIMVPTHATAPMPIGSTIVLVIKPGEYSVFVSAEDLGAMVIHGAGVGSNMIYELGAGNGGAMATLVKIGTNEWMISGTGLAEWQGP